jgi:hypothetical protein
MNKAVGKVYRYGCARRWMRPGIQSLSQRVPCPGGRGPRYAAEASSSDSEVHSSEDTVAADFSCLGSAADPEEVEASRPHIGSFCLGRGFRRPKRSRAAIVVPGAADSAAAEATVREAITTPASPRRATDDRVEGVGYGDAAVAEADVSSGEDDEDEEDDQVSVEQARALRRALHHPLQSLLVAASTFDATSTWTSLSLTSKPKALKFGCLALMLILVDGRDGAKTRSPCLSRHVAKAGREPVAPGKPTLSFPDSSATPLAPCVTPWPFTVPAAVPTGDTGVSLLSRCPPPSLSGDSLAATASSTCCSCLSWRATLGVVEACASLRYSPMCTPSSDA